MCTNTQTLSYECATLAACLCREARVHSNDLMSNTCSLGSENVEERAPTGVEDRFRKMMVLDHVEDTQILNGDMVIAKSILPGNFEMMVAALPVDLQVRLILSLLPP